MKRSADSKPGRHKNASARARFSAREMRPTDWPLVAKLFGDNGACGGCWCMWWRTATHGKTWTAAVGEPNRKTLQRLVKSGKARAILAFDGSLPVGWCSFGLRTEFPHTESMKAYRRDDIAGVWSINCFFIDKRYRSRGVASLLAEAAVKVIKKHKGKVIEAYPVPRTQAGEKLPSAFVWPGPEVIFQRLGFTEVQRLSASRPLYRLEV
ncbi:MAG: GNAT family N-acetyltransferase [candidate division Zixibacteria bacterium]|nr:GNAT family N-acetyltransferase [candidate division Zixibacteria bacterium]